MRAYISLEDMNKVFLFGIVESYFPITEGYNYALPCRSWLSPFDLQSHNIENWGWHNQVEVPLAFEIERM